MFPYETGEFYCLSSFVAPDRLRLSAVVVYLILSLLCSFEWIGAEVGGLLLGPHTHKGLLTVKKEVLVSNHSSSCGVLLW